jgi:hypothetical protein
MTGGPVIVGITISFSVNDQPAPFTSTMTVKVDSSISALDIPRTVIADPQGPEPQKTVTVHVIVGAPLAWDLSVIPDFGNIAPGGRTTFTVQVTGASGGASIQLIQSPPVLGISVSFSVNNQPAPFESIMTVSVDPSKPEGIYPIEVWAHPSDTSFPGPDNKMKAIKVVVGAPPPAFDFSISASPPTQTVTASKSASYIITISLVAGAAQPVTLDLTGLPPYVTYTFNPSSSNPTFQSTLEVVTSASTTPGTYRLNMTASGGEVTKTASLMLEIQAAAEVEEKGKPPSILDTIKENSLILIALLMALVIVTAALAMRRRKPSTLPATPGVFCVSCGSKIPDDAEFCPKCSAKKVVSL